MFLKLNNISKKIFELTNYQDQNDWKQNLTPIEISNHEEIGTPLLKNESNRVVDLMVYKKSLCSHEKKTCNFRILGKHAFKFDCRRCFSSQLCQIPLKQLEQKCD